ncbi:hypothetical protein SDC9_120224 [bioreactor metagenome]|uniref:Uncharacterized protein n=1 Tax=bioreactor metagenome TaxID=1076179 RepID=A0A645C797_9ZZZZ
MDFGRYPYIFGNELQDVAERTKIMNAFMKQLRDDIPADKKINVRILIPTDSRAINYGLDYITWVKNGYIDRLITSDQSYESFSSFDEFVKLCADNKCEYYLGIVSDVAGHDLTKEEEALMKQGLLKPSNIKTNLYTSEFILRGYEGYAKGADGIFVFNGICTEKDDFVDPMFQYLNNKTEAMKWYEFEYPSYSAFYLTEAATAVPEEISGFTPEKPAVSNVPDNTKNINPIWWIAGAAGIIIITLTAILISKKKTGKTGKSK